MRSNSAALDVIPYFTTSYRPARNSRRGSVARTDGSIDDRVWLVEGADQVLAERVIDADLPADGAVDLRQERRRHVHERDATEIGRRGESGHVADHAAAECDECRRPIGVRADQRFVDARDGLKLLEALAVGHDDWLGALERLGESAAVKPPDERDSRPQTAARAAGARPAAGRAARATPSASVTVYATRRGRDVDANRIHVRTGMSGSSLKLALERSSLRTWPLAARVHREC